MKNAIGRDGGALTYGYDGSLPTDVTWSGTIKGKVGVTYNNDFAVVTQSVNDGQTVSYAYDDDGLLTQAGDLTATYDPQNGAIQGTTIGNVTDLYGYTPFGEVQDYTASVGGVGVYLSSFTYDKLGRISTKTETVKGETHTYQYGYDSIGQLTDVWVDGSLKSHYDYDSNGNRVGGTYDDQDRMIKYGENTYQYSANGELQEKVTPTGTTKYEYDVLGNLTAVTLEDGTKIEYVIDGANRRVGKKVNGVLVQGWLYQDGLKPVAEIDAGGNIVVRFVYGIRRNVPDYMIKNGTTYRIISDNQGSPRVIVDTITGQTVERIDYDEFGNVTLDTNPGFQPFGFAGGLYDKDTGLVRFGARDYNSETGRWTAKDPLRFNGGQGDFYRYCLNDPINYLDPTGKELDIETEENEERTEEFEEPAVDPESVPDPRLMEPRYERTYNMKDIMDNLDQLLVNDYRLIVGFFFGDKKHKHENKSKGKRNKPCDKQPDNPFPDNSFPEEWKPFNPAIANLLGFGPQPKRTFSPPVIENSDHSVLTVWR